MADDHDDHVLQWRINQFYLDHIQTLSLTDALMDCYQEDTYGFLRCHYVPEEAPLQLARDNFSAALKVWQQRFNSVSRYRKKDHRE